MAMLAEVMETGLIEAELEAERKEQAAPAIMLVKMTQPNTTLHGGVFKSLALIYAALLAVFWLTFQGDEEALFMERGVRFGKALQMINILRDIPEDLRFGRCYIPEEALRDIGMTPDMMVDDSNLDTFRPLYNRYLDLTNEHLEAATAYIGMIPETQFRLKASCMLPVLVGQRTVTLLRDGNILNSDERIKVTRDEMKTYGRKLLRALLIPGGVKRLLEKNKDASSNL